MPAPGQFVATAIRVVAALTVCTFLAMLAYMIEPYETAASNTHHVIAGSLKHDPHAGMHTLGTLQGGQYEITIYAGPREPLYTVREAVPTGSTPYPNDVAILLTRSELAASFPELDLNDLLSGSGASRMLAEPNYPGF